MFFYVILVIYILIQVCWAYIGDIKSGTGQNQEVGMKRPCDTRWGSHYGSLLNILSIYSSICEVLEDISEVGNCQDQRAEARRLLRSLLKFDFVFCLHLMVDILEITNDLNKTLQRKDQDIVNAMEQVRTSKTRLQDMRDRGWGPLLEKVTSFCKKNNSEILNMEDPYYDGISRRRGSQVTCRTIELISYSVITCKFLMLFYFHS